MRRRQFNRVAMVVMAVLLCVAVSPASAAKKRSKDKGKPAKSSPPPPAPAKPAAKEATDYASDPLRIVFVGEVMSVDADKRTIMVKGESRQQGKTIGGVGTHTFVLSTSCLVSTAKKIIATLDDVAAGDMVEITYKVSGGRNIAASIAPSSVKKSEKKTDAGKK